MNKMDPLIATMDQSSIGNKTKNLTSGPNSKEHSSKSIHKTDQESTSPIKPIHSDSVSPPFDGLSSKNNHFAGKNYHHTNNLHEESHDPAQVLHDKHEYDDNKDLVVVGDYNSMNIRRNQDSNISDTMANLSIDSSGNKVNNMNQNNHHQLEGTSTSSPISSHPIAPNRTSATNSTNTTVITTTPTPIPIPSTTPILTSCIDMSSKNCELSEACIHQPTPSSLPTSAALPRISDNIVPSNGRALGNHIVGKDASFMQQRRQPPIVKAQSLDYGCDVDYEVDQVQSHLQNSHYLFQHNHLHHNHSNHRNHHLHNQHLHHNNHFPHHWTSSSSSLSGRKHNQTITKGCSLDNRRSEEDDGPQCSNIISTTTTEDVDADVDEDDDEELAIKRAPTFTANSLRSHTLESDTPSPHHLPRGSFDSTSSTGDTTDSSQQTDSAGGVRLTSPQPRQHNLPKGILPKVQSLESRPIYPNVPYSPYASPYGSPRSNRRRTPLRESRRISIEQSGSFLQLNQYKLMDQIGQGSYGLVKLAYSEEDSTHYAMKILSKRRLLRKAGLMSRGPKKTTSPLDRVYREIAVLKKLDHPNVVKLVEVLDDPLEDSLYLVFELVKQGEVLEIPTDKPLTEERAWSVFRDAVQGLEYLHYQRIIHADIKPGNLLLTECGHVKIADLGVCNEFLGEDATMNNGSTAGTPAFRAPETLFPGQHLYSGKAADIWALGATLYSLVYGNVPFVANSVPLLYEKIKNETLMIPEKPTVSDEMVDLIKKMLTKDPAKRITLPKIKEHLWVTANGAHILPSEDDNCRLVQISEEDINSVVKSIPKLDTLILIKTMLKNHSFLNPFNRGISGRAPQRGGSRLERFTRAGRSNSAPGAYHSPIDRQLSGDSILPALSEHGGISSNNDASEDF